jgi:signal transduction histidine kinase
MAGNDTLHSAAALEAVRGISEDRFGNIWATRPDGTVSIQQGGIGAACASDNAAGGVALIHDRNGNMWIGTRGNGLHRIVCKGSGSRRAVERYSEDQGLSSDVVRSLFEDRDGNLWIGTQNGLSLLADRNTEPTLDTRSGVASPIPARLVAADPRGNMWIGSDDGLYRYDGPTILKLGRETGLPSVAINALHIDTMGGVWVATERGVANFQDGKFRSLPVPVGKQLGRVSSIARAVGGAVWIADLDGGVFRWHEGELSRITATWARSLYADRSGRVWIGLRDGHLLVYQDNPLQTLSTHDWLVGTDITSFYENKNGTLWIGTSDGIGYVDADTFNRLPKDAGFPITRVIGILEDRSEDLWIATASGIVRVGRRVLEEAIRSSSTTLRYTLFDASDGFGGTPAYQGSSVAALSTEGILWFVTGTSVVRLNPLALTRNQAAPVVHLQDILVDGTRLHMSELSLPAGTSRLEVAYTSPTLTNSSKIHFRYRLDGFDDDWIDAGTRREAFYTNLPPGQYQLRAAAVNGGLQGETRTLLVFSIAPFVYQTTWFKAACVLLFTVALIAAWQLRLRYVRRKFSFVLAERSRLAHELHDTLLQGLIGLTLGLDEVLSEVSSAPKRAARRIEDLRNQVETYVRETRQSIWDLHSSALERRDLADVLAERIGPLVGSEPVRLHYTVNGAPRRCAPTVAEQILRVGQEAVTNTLRHARANNVWIELCYQDNAILLRVADDGRGFDPDRPTTDDRAHCGVAIMRERVTRVGGRFMLSSAHGQGTRVEARVPLS